MTDWFLEALSGIPLAWRVVLLSMVPVVELRGSIPLALAWGMAPARAFFLAVGANLLPVVPLLLSLEPLSRWLGRFPLLGHLLEILFTRARRHSRQVEKYGVLGLALFVAVPAPGTGVWTGCVLAFLLGIRFWYALGAIALGVIIAGLVVTLAGLGLLQLFYVFGVEALAGAVLLALAYWWWRRRR